MTTETPKAEPAGANGVPSLDPAPETDYERFKREHPDMIAREEAALEASEWRLAPPYDTDRDPGDEQP